jgi:quinol monooxygenase YgiN
VFRYAYVVLRAPTYLIPGCHLYVVSLDPADDVAVWVYEVWANAAAHTVSLQDERVRALIAEARPLPGGPPAGTSLNVLGGHGIA